MKQILHDRVIRATLVGCCLMLLIIGIPRFLGDLMMVPGKPVLLRISHGEVIDDKALTTLETSRLQSLKFSQNPAAYANLGLSYFLRAHRSEAGEDRQNFVRMSIQATQQSLELKPTDAYAWARLSSAYLMLASPPFPEAVHAWRRSVETARFDPRLLFQRFHLGVLLYDHLSSSEIDMLRDQTQLGYTWWNYKFRSYCWRHNLVDWAIFLLPEDDNIKGYLSTQPQ